MEVTVLRGWLRAAKGTRTFDGLARRATAGGLIVSACTLRRALDGRLPTRRTVLAFARGSGADEQVAERLWEAAAEAGRRPPARARAPYVSDQVATLAGLARAMRRLRTAAGGPTLRELAAAPGAAGRFSRSALHLALAGRRLPGERLLTGFAAACGASEETAGALLAARRRILAGPPPRRPAYPCAIVEEAESRRLQDGAARPWLTEPDLDWYDRQLRDEEEARTERMITWVDSLSAEELQALQRQARAGGGVAAGEGGGSRRPVAPARLRPGRNTAAWPREARRSRGALQPGGVRAVPEAPEQHGPRRESQLPRSRAGSEVLPSVRETAVARWAYSARPGRPGRCSAIRAASARTEGRRASRGAAISTRRNWAKAPAGTDSRVYARRG
ncbi:hypothetical protein ACGRHY_29305 [Streptomyces sp. HK10]|uniref:hypothetical protein n=1 Tax=Streptomyces sp. HK10 TaxID=3373255 RepID=UPI00374A1A6A